MAETALNLPTVARYNLRSLFPNINNLKTDMQILLNVHNFRTGGETVILCHFLDNILHIYVAIPYLGLGM